jgi:predicted dehydrogenase
LTPGALRLVAIGCGRVFERYHLPAIRATPEVLLVGTSDPDPIRCAWARAALRVPCVASLEELLHTVRADAALVASPPSGHAAITERLLRAGLHVLVEKPMALTVVEARHVAEAQRQTGLAVRVGFNRRYRPEYARIRRGAPKQSHVEFTFIAEAGRWGERPPGAEEFVMHDAGSHAVDLIAHVAGSPITRIRARNQEDASGCVLNLDAQLGNGASATCCIGQSARYREELTGSAAGWTERAVATTTPLNTLKLGLRRLTGRPSPAHESFHAQLSGFVAACHGNTDGIGADASAGLASVAAIIGALRSLASTKDWYDVTDLPGTSSQ